MRIAVHFEKTTGEYGLRVITETGWCLPMDAPQIEEDCTTRFILVPIPESKGAIFKTLDGTKAKIVTVKMLTDGQQYKCVKIKGQVNPLAPVQDGGWASGNAALEYEITWQEVGDVA